MKYESKGVVSREKKTSHPVSWFLNESHLDGPKLPSEMLHLGQGAWQKKKYSTAVNSHSADEVI